MSSSRISLISTLFSKLLPLVFVISCARELPTYESDYIKKNIYSFEEIENSVSLTLAKEEGTQSSLYLADQVSSYKVTSIDGEEHLKPLFKDLKVNLPQEVSALDVQFKVTKNYLVAYTVIEDGENNLLNLKRESNQYNLFQYRISSFGIKRRSKNSLEEETRNIEFVQTTKDEATHFSINPLPKNRISGGLQNLSQKEKRELVVASELEKRSWTSQELRTLFNDSTVLRKSKLSGENFEDNSQFVLRVFKNYLYIYRVVTESELSRKEKSIITNNFNVTSLMRCDDHVAKEYSLSSTDCFLRSEYKVQVTQVKPKLAEDTDGEKLAQTTLVPTDRSERSNLLKISVNDFLDTRSELYSAFPQLDGKVILNKKESLDLEGDYLYVPSIHDTPRLVVDAAPFFQGQEKIVRLKMTDKGISVFQKDEDSRFDEDRNIAPVLEISGSHLDFDCLSKEKGRCLGPLSPVVNPEWEKRKYFAPNLDRLKILELNTLNLFNLRNSCFMEVDSKMTHHEFKPGVINIEQEKTFKIHKSSMCAVKLFYDSNLRSASFKVKFFYSLVKLDRLASSNYEAVNYPIQDTRKFGFFKNSSKKLAQDYTSSREETKHLLNRFNPKKGDIEFKLSKNFSKGENKYIYDATVEVVKRLNKSLKQADAGIQIKLSTPEKVFPGDLRNNSIVLIEDPLANGLLGYGPSVTNPNTGEIVQAHTNMYIGVLRQQSRSVYKFLEELSKEQPITVPTPPAPAVTPTTAGPVPGGTTNFPINLFNINQLLNKPSVSIDDHDAIEKIHGHEGHDHHAHEGHSSAKISDVDYSPFFSNFRDIPHGISAEDLIEKLGEDNFIKKRNDLYAKNNAFHKDFLNYGALGKVITKEIKQMTDIIDTNGHLIAWEKLNSDQKERVIKAIVKQAYTTTLAHELGHNLGLRHNFSGSYDKDNFYTKAEVASYIDTVPQYSSIMDYGLSQLNELPIFGKYDIAALRFGYARKVEDNLGNIVDLGQSSLNDFEKSNPATKLKKYRFCTDENAGASIECNRFDEGTSITELVKSEIRNYKHSYRFANMRDGRENFKSYNLPGYVWYRARTFFNIRRALGRFFQMANYVGMNQMKNGCAPSNPNPICELINDRKVAADLAGNFFMDILVTPDLSCALAKNATPNTLETIAPFATIYESVKISANDKLITSCFHPEIKGFLSARGYTVMAQAGRLINDLKGSDDRHSYRSDIDVRGVWIDKVLAVKFMLSRRPDTELSRSNPMNFLDHPLFTDKIINYFEHLLVGQRLKTRVPFKTEAGNDLNLNYQLDGINLIPSQDTWYPTLVFGFPPYSGENLNTLIINNALKDNFSTHPSLKETTKAFKKYFSLYVKNPSESFNTENTISTYYKDNYYVATKQNTVAYNAIRIINDHDLVASAPSSAVANVLGHRLNPTIPSTWTQDQKDVYSMPENVLKQILSIKLKNITIDPAQINASYPPAQAQKILKAFAMTVADLELLIKAKTELPNTPPAGATDVEKKLFKASVESLQLKVMGQLTQVVEKLQTKLPHFPRMKKDEVLELLRGF